MDIIGTLVSIVQIFFYLFSIGAVLATVMALSAAAMIFVTVF